MQHINPLNFLGTAILGAALLWAVKLAYGRRRATSDDLVKRLMLLAGWMLLLTGTVGVVVGLSGPFALVPLLGAVVAAVGYFKYMTAERRALLWALAVAAEKGIPLEQAARAFADERGVQIGVRVSRLADMLESGVPLPYALDMTRNPLPADALLAARLGQATGRLGPALRMSIRHSEMFDRTMREAFGPDLLPGGRGPGRHDRGQFCDAQDRARVREDVLRIRTRAAGGHPVADRDRRPVGVRDPPRLSRTADHAAVGLFVFHPLVAVRVARLEPLLAAERRCAWSCRLCRSPSNRGGN